MAPNVVSVRQSGDAAVIDMPKLVDLSTEQLLGDASSRAPGAGPVILNFTRTEYINSSGIAVIAEILGMMRKAGRALVAYGLSDHYREIFEITRLSDFIAVRSDERSALAVSM